jgi:aminoglycoside phosphotransferase (APT) family kinase protein
MHEQRYVDGRAGIDAQLVARLIAAQFPQWRHLPVLPVEHDGWDNRTYHLGADMSVRLPAAAGYVPAVDKEHRWLPVLARSLPVPVPVPLAAGQPGEGYPFPWSVRGWLGGQPASRDGIGNQCGLATDVAGFIGALHRIDPTGGPAAGAHSFFRGATLTHYDAETRRALVALTNRIDTAAVETLWNDALAASWHGPPVWFHGDVAAGNLLVVDGRLSAVIDFGTCGVGDPACDLVIAWTLFTGNSRAAFRAAVGLDPATWARARGWALWKALISLAEDIDIAPALAEVNLPIIEDVLADATAAARPDTSPRR